MLREKAMIKWIIFFLLVFLPVISFSQDEQKIRPFFPNVEKTSAFDIKIDREKKEAKTLFLPWLLIYKAVRTEDLSVCQTEDCKNKARDLLQTRYMGEGRCEKLISKSEQELCKAMKSNECRKLSDVKGDLCQAILDEDVDRMVELMNQAALSQKTSGIKKTNKDKRSKYQGILSGFKHYSPVACERHLNNTNLPLLDKLSCDILFSADVDKEIDDLLTDLAFLNLSYKEGDRNLCNRIKNAIIKKTCTTSRKKNISELFL